MVAELPIYWQICWQFLRPAHNFLPLKRFEVGKFSQRKNRQPSETRVPQALPGSFGRICNFGENFFMRAGEGQFFHLRWGFPNAFYFRRFFF